MARKKSPSRGPEAFRPFLLGMALILGLALAAAALVFGFRTLAASALFRVQAVRAAESLQPLDLGDLQKLKGKNIFTVDLDKVEAGIHARHPGIADLRVTRRYPDEIYVTGIRREAFAVVAIDGRQWLVDRNGYMIAAPGPEHKSLTLVKGLMRQKAASGAPVVDRNIRTAFDIMALFGKDPHLAGLVLRSVDVGDLTRIACDVVDGESGFLALIDKDNIPARLKTLAEVLMRGGIDLAQVKYMDLRFGAPVIGQKKARP